MDDERLAGVERLYGPGTLARLAALRVAVVGLGGVGGWAAEALARSGVGALTLIDGDEVCLSNTNRQLQALAGGYGRAKTAVLGERLRAIRPELILTERFAFLGEANLEALLEPAPDLVLDACDQLPAKLALALHCRRRRIALVTAGAAGGRRDPTRIAVADLAATEQDPLLAELRRRLRRALGWPPGSRRRFGMRAVFSREPPAPRTACTPGTAPGRLDCRGALGSAMHVTAAFGLVAAGEALRLLLRSPGEAGGAS
ncbi:MAG: tRNA threonylcarbamoyladenosine dehydratase [Xanthomonadales bacterium]|nr:tRNA threonylcarbamoyladenosine dehydratase [Xanthomonadales bacterium]